MLSVVICSRETSISTKLKANINETIGSDYEIIIIDNSRNQYNIFQAYNEGVKLSTGDILCFMHDDILFHSENWGNKVCEYFEKYPNLGCLGVAGSHLLLNTPSSFWHSGTFCTHYYSRDASGNLQMEGLPDEGNEGKLLQVASVDGMWMCIRKKMFDTIRFDDESYSGFHCYDSDICMQIIQAGYDIGIAFGVAVEHNKRGNQDTTYFKNIRIWYNKWEESLPLARGKQYSPEEIAARTFFVKQIVELEEQVAILESVHKSKSYRLGKALIAPIKKIRKK